MTDRLLSAFRLPRRQALGIAGAALASTALPGRLTAATRRLDPANPADAGAIYRKLRYRIADGLVFSWLKGPYMAALEGDLIPMYAINLGSMQRVTHNPDGSFDLIDLEISFRVDVESGRRLTRFRNPVTGETVPVGGRPAVPTRVRYGAANEPIVPAVPGGALVELTHLPVVPFEIRPGEIAVRDRTHGRITAPGGAVSFLNEVSTISAPRDLVLDPSTTSVETRAQSNDVRSWPEWLGMGNRPGHLALFGNGGKVGRFAELPEDWRAMLEEVYPAIAADPVGALGG